MAIKKTVIILLLGVASTPTFASTRANRDLCRQAIVSGASTNWAILKNKTIEVHFSGQGVLQLEIKDTATLANEFGLAGENAIGEIFKLATAASHEAKEFAVVGLRKGDSWIFSAPVAGETNQVSMDKVTAELEVLMKSLRSQFDPSTSDVVIFHNHPSGSPFNMVDRIATDKVLQFYGLRSVIGVALGTNVNSISASISFIYRTAN
jgi:hypothetical protein